MFGFSICEIWFLAFEIQDVGRILGSLGRSLRFSEASQKAVGGPFVASSWCLVASLPAKTAPASIDGSPTQRLGAVWGFKMAFKALPERRKIF